MKRLTLLTILLVVVGIASGFALEVKPSFTLAAWGKVEWGVDLDTGGTGFQNTSDADLTVTFMAADGTDTHKGEGGWYGEIKISDVEVWLGGDDVVQAADNVPWTGDWLVDADVSAKIVGMGGALAIGVYAAPTVGWDNVAGFEQDSYDDNVIDTAETTDIGVYYTGNGTYVSYQVNEMFMVGLDVISASFWTTNTAQAYAFDGAVQVKFGEIQIDAGASYGFNYADDPIQFGVKVADATAPLAWSVAFDATTSPAFAWEVGGSVTLTLENTDTVAVMVAYGDAFLGLDAYLKFTEPAAAGLVDNLDFYILGAVLDVDGGPMEYEVQVDGGYKMGDWYPNATVTFGDAENGVVPTWGYGQFLTVVAGIDYTGIPLTTLGLYYTSGNLLAPTYGTIVVSAKVTY